MSVRDSARHRARHRAANPLSDLADTVTGQFAAVTGQFGAIGRGSAVAAASAGLVAAGGITATNAHAAIDSSNKAAAFDAVAFSSTSNAFSSGLLTTQGQPALGAALSAPATAKVQFETGTFTAIPAPRPVAAPVAAPVAEPAPARADTPSRATKARKASTSSSKSSSSKAAPSGAAKGSSVLSIAARYVGIPYRYGGTTPAGFDCSGYTRYVYKQLGVSLPRTANQQMNATTRVSRSAAKPGDLVFFVSGGRAYHNGIYAGGNSMYDSPRSGKSISKREIWSSAVVFGRVSR